MSLTATDRGSGGIASATTLVCTPTSNFTAGALAVLVLAYDNSGSAGADPFTSISDSLGNAWTSRQRALHDPGAASAGEVLGIFTAVMTRPLTTANTVSVVVSAAAVAAFALFEVTSSLGNPPLYGTGGVGTGSTTGAPTVTTTSITSGQVVIGGGAGQSADAWTGDADTASGNWSTHQHNGSGTGATGMSVTGQSKVTTGTATQTYNPTCGATTTAIVAWISVTEDAPALRTIRIYSKAISRAANG